MLPITYLMRYSRSLELAEIISVGKYTNVRKGKFHLQITYPILGINIDVNYLVFFGSCITAKYVLKLIGFQTVAE